MIPINVISKVICSYFVNLYSLFLFFFFFSLRKFAGGRTTGQSSGGGRPTSRCLTRCPDCEKVYFNLWINKRFFFEPVSGKKFIHVFLTSANIFPSASRRSCCCRNKPKNSSGVSYSFKPISCKLKPCATWSVVLSRALVSFFWSTWIICWLLVRVI